MCFWILVRVPEDLARNPKMQKHNPRSEKMQQLRESLKLKFGEKYRQVYMEQIPKQFLDMKLKDFIEQYGDIQDLHTVKLQQNMSSVSNIPVPISSTTAAIKSVISTPVLIDSVGGVTKRDRTEIEQDNTWRMSVVPGQDDADHRRITIQGSSNGEFEFSMLVPNKNNQQQSSTQNIDQMSVEELRRLQDNLRAAQEHTNQLLAALGV